MKELEEIKAWKTPDGLIFEDKEKAEEGLIYCNLLSLCADVFFVDNDEAADYARTILENKDKLLEILSHETNTNSDWVKVQPKKGVSIYNTDNLISDGLPHIDRSYDDFNMSNPDGKIDHTKVPYENLEQLQKDDPLTIVSSKGRLMSKGVMWTEWIPFTAFCGYNGFTRDSGAFSEGWKRYED